MNRQNILQQFLQNRTIVNRNAAVLANRGLIHLVVRRYHLAPDKAEDAFQEGIPGLIKALETYDPTRGSFSTHAINKIRTEVGHWFEKTAASESCISVNGMRAKPTSRRVNLSEPAHSDEAGTTVGDLIPCALESPEAITDYKKVREIVAKMPLDEIEELVLNERLLRGDEGESLSHLASLMECSRETIRKIEVRLKGRLREALR